MSELPKKQVMISLKEVSKRFGPGPARRSSASNGEASTAGPRYAVDRVSLDVLSGELLVLLGGSGCGKTTTLKMINRLIEPTEGTIEIKGEAIIRDGRPVPGKKPEDLRREIGYVIQGSGLFPHMRIKDNIAVVPRLLGWKEDRIRERVRALLELIGLRPEHGDQYPRELSGGMQQRVGFARAVAAHPPLMLLDEPFGALDPIKRDEVRRAFQAIREKENLTAVMVTHDMTEALLLADKIAVMNEGKLVQFGTPRDLLTAPNHEYVTKLIKGPLEETRQVEKLLAESAAGGVE